MTIDERTSLEKDVLYALYVAEREVSAQRVLLGMVGERLVRLGTALQEHPELVTSLSEPHNPDYREELNEIGDRAKLLAYCNKVRELEQKKQMVVKRKSMLNL